MESYLLGKKWKLLFHGAVFGDNAEAHVDHIVLHVVVGHGDAAEDHAPAGAVGPDRQAEHGVVGGVRLRHVRVVPLQLEVHDGAGIDPGEVERHGRHRGVRYPNSVEAEVVGVGHHRVRDQTRDALLNRVVHGGREVRVRRAGVEEHATATSRVDLERISRNAHVHAAHAHAHHVHPVVRIGRRERQQRRVHQPQRVRGVARPEQQRRRRRGGSRVRHQAEREHILVAHRRKLRRQRDRPAPKPNNPIVVVKYPRVIIHAPHQKPRIHPNTVRQRHTLRRQHPLNLAPISIQILNLAVVRIRLTRHRRPKLPHRKCNMSGTLCHITGAVSYYERLSCVSLIFPSDVGSYTLHSL
jgi:hypothetical protein